MPSNLFLSLYLEYSWKLNLLQMNVDLQCWQQACSHLIGLTEASLLNVQFTHYDKFALHISMLAVLDI